ncbi:hypothetical protein TMatcc_004094 [Talaromyces marneffei ATCC 18224]|uniref:Vacuolar import and degradation protein n=2 Tax=Talaromyces marneffei (strain ATCC 18224 / CBS 334.59 / QM 7333) TaxID=441960 RepID=B6Q6H3_TALMQ|nr:uncharacterized protein EYB26_000928 [Talaromyces marneffei]EEA27599.1 conserved hypothetical protein [Talaromyces marneffei ATCC 18224]KAE8556704.1 hypothetical protein EYB25_001407 [Talaromyces marneffei]QGA13280.1 hypothetical protein EYB26_000928 [Talaromyces marneffei]
MPPTTSPTETPGVPSSAVANRYFINDFQMLSDPVPNLAATLTHLPPTEAEDANHENVNFLRTRPHSPSESSSRARRRRLALLPEVDLESMDIDEQRRFLPLSTEAPPRLPSSRRSHEVYNTNLGSDGRISGRRSLYGWAPGSEGEQGNDYLGYQHTSQNETSDSIWTVGRGQDREASRNTPLSRSSRRDVTGSALPSHTVDSTETTDPSSRHWSDHNSNTFTEALLQSVRRGARYASRTRALQNYLLDRERLTRQEANEREREDREREQERDRDRERRGATSSSSSRTLRMSLRNISGDLRDRLNSHRYLLSENPPSAKLRETIKYLERVRTSSSLSESIETALKGGVVQYDYLKGAYNDSDFILDTSFIKPPAPSSWLRPGAVFAGSQKAVNSIAGHNFNMLSHRVSQPTESSVDDSTTRISVSTSSGRRYWANDVSLSPFASHHHQSQSSKHELWPVKVTIHSVDYSTMTLSGTMEAYNIPDKTSPTRDAHIITFLEGEIVDLNAHSLETTSFQADADIDCTYWRELRPFRGLSDDQMTKNLLSKTWVTDELNKNWILMRWKERCFITPTDARQGLTISGFYYISLRRGTGEIEGLYYDPGSSPYQQLSLKPERPTVSFPAVDFR